VICSEVVTVSIIIRRYTDHTKFASHMTVHHISFIFLVLFCIIVYMVVCFVCFYFVNYVFLLLYLCILIVMYVPFWVFCFFALFCALFVCKCVLYYCHRMSTQLQLTNTYIGQQRALYMKPCMPAPFHSRQE
jgi:hypothetical protein